MREIKIGDKIIGKDHPTYIIAEIGSNHDGSLEKAKKLIKCAANCGANAVKFQLFKADTIAADTDDKLAILENGKTLYQLYKENETPYEWVYELNEYCKRNKIDFLATPFDNEAVDVLESVDIIAYKIASFEIVDYPLIDYIASKNKPIILSTGMASLEDIDEALNVIKNHHSEFILLHCGISYPLSLKDVNLRAIQTLKKNYNCPVGYSDHTEGYVVPILGVAIGMDVIERHITLDKKLNGPDHRFATPLKDFKDMVQYIRDAELALGVSEKIRVESEEIHYKRGRRSLFIIKDIKKGTILDYKHIAILRPGIGLHPKHLNEIIGKKIKRNISKYTPISWDLLN